MLAAALEAEVAAYVEEHQQKRDEQGHRLVVRNGKTQTRTVVLGSGAVEIEATRVNDKRVDAGGPASRYNGSTGGKSSG